MNDQPQPKALIVYDDEQNEYSISNHNLTEQQAIEFMNEWQPHLKPHCTFITIDQNRPHKSPDAKDCRACRNDVRRALISRLNKVPRFTRRKE